MWQGVLGRATYDCLVSPAYIVLQPLPLTDPRYAEYLLSTETAIAKFKRMSYGVVDDRLRLYFRDLTRIRFAVPRAIDEQISIAERLTQIDASIRQTQTAVEKLRQQKIGLTSDLLNGRVRANLAEAAIT